MSERKRILVLDRYEHRVLVNTLCEKRNNLIKEQKTTDLLDEVLLKTINAPEKRLFRKKEKIEDKAR